MKNIKILVATHKPYVFPEDDSIYVPIQVGCDEVEERFGYTGDNTGDNNDGTSDMGDLDGDGEVTEEGKLTVGEDDDGENWGQFFPV